MDPIAHVYQKMNEKGVEEARHHTKPPTRFRPSEAADCGRQIWFRLNGQRPAPRNASSDMYGVRGDVDHDVTRQILNHHGSTVHGVTYANGEGAGEESIIVQKNYTVESPVGPIEIMVSGRADGEIDLDIDPEKSLPTPGTRALCEIKGTGYWPYDWLNKAYELGGHEAAVKRVKEKHPKWYLQCQATMALTGHTKCYLIIVDRSSGTIGLYNQNTNEREGIVLDFDKAVWEELLQKFAYIKRKLDADEMPPAEFSAKSKECSYCPFYYACHGAAERRQKGLEPVILYPGPQIEEYHDGADRPDEQS